MDLRQHLNHASPSAGGGVEETDLSRKTWASGACRRNAETPCVHTQRERQKLGKGSDRKRSGGRGPAQIRQMRTGKFKLTTPTTVKFRPSLCKSRFTIGFKMVFQRGSNMWTNETTKLRKGCLVGAQTKETQRDTKTELGTKEKRRKNTCMFHPFSFIYLSFSHL